MALEWVNVMVTWWASAVNGGRCVIITVIINDCRSINFGANVVGIVFERRRRYLNFLGVSNDDRFVNVNHGGKY
jgi:hypothetical protein